MKKVNRRKFFSTSLMAAAAVSVPVEFNALAKPQASEVAENIKPGPMLTDTNVNLFAWPFRQLKYGNTQDLVEKLRSHRVSQAWAGSFESLFHKDIEGVNARLTEECKAHGKGMLLPFGTVNLAWPDWQEDLRRCHEVHAMKGIRIFPSYQTFDLNHPDFPALVSQVAKRGLVLQIVGDMDDSRNHHPIVLARQFSMEPLVEVLKKEPGAKVQLLYWNHRVGNPLMDRMIKETQIVFDTARVESSGAVGRMIEGKPWNGSALPVPQERILFGSHAPFFPVETGILKLMESPLTQDEAKAIMEDNAQKFLQA